jgi:peptidoglycan/LPS O-acetylase OafA/YrhL
MDETGGDPGEDWVPRVASERASRTTEAAKEHRAQIAEARIERRRIRWREACFVLAGFVVLVVAGLLANANHNHGAGIAAIVVGIVIALALFINARGD